MANRNGPRNDANRPGPTPKTDKILLDQAVRGFVENGFETAGGEFYQKFLDNHPLEKDFLSYLKTKEGFKSILPEGKGFPNSLFAAEIRKAAFSLSNLRKAAKEAFALEYDVPADRQVDLERRITELRPTELKELLGSAKERAETVRWVTKKRPESIRKGWKEYLDTLQSEAGFTAEDRARLENYVENAKWITNVENAKTAFRMGVVSEDEIRTILGLIRTPEAKRALVKALLPKIAISELVRMKIVWLTEAREAVVKKIMESETADGFSELLAKDAGNGLPSTLSDDQKRVEITKKVRSFVEEFDLAHFYVDTLKIEDHDLDIVLEKSDLPKILEEKVSQGMEELKRALDPEKDLDADEDGNVAISFAEKIAREFSGNDEAKKNIRNVSMFLESAKGAKEAQWNVPNETILEGIVKNDTGTEGRVRLKIKKWLEFPPNNERKIAIAYLDENGTEATQDTVSYEEFYRLVYRLENREFLNEDSLGRKVRVEDSTNKRVLAQAEAAATPEEREALLDTIAPVAIENFAELEEMFDDIDPNGKSHGIKPGVSVTLGKPWDSKYNVVTIESIDAASRNITVLDTRSSEWAWRRSVVPFGEFYRICRINWAVRSPGINSPERMLDALASSVVKGYFEGLSIDGDSDSMKFVPKDKRWQQGYEGVKVFYKKNGEAIQIGEMENGRVQIRMLDSFESGNQANGEKPKGTSSSQFMWYGYETLYMLIRKHELVPHVGIAWELVVKQPEFESKGRIKKLLDHPSIYDFIHGLQEIPKFVKKKLEHSSHHHAAHMTLAIAGKIPGFPDDWLTDLQMEIHNEDKSTLGKEVDRLNSFSSPKRHEQALRYLKDEGARDYEIIAATLSLLEKHGNLYPGVLAKYEKDWLFYARMPGSAKEKEEFLRKKRVNPDGTEREVKEPEIIMLWLMELSKKEHHPLSPYYWLEVKKKWKAGSTGEFEAGGNEGKQLETLTRRADHAINKLKGKEYAHAIGAMEEIWNKPNDLWGTVSWRMRVPFIFAMCNARENIHSEIAQKFTPMFDSWHTYPPLLFIQNKDRQDVFRKVIEKLSTEAGWAMAVDFGKVKRLWESKSVGVDAKTEKEELLIGELDSFWAKYGDVLSKKLLVSVEDPEIFIRKNEVPFGEYLKIVGGEYGNTKFDGAEIDCGTYEISGANWSLAAPGAYVRQFKIQAGHGWFNSELEIYLFDKYMAAIEAVRKTTYSDDNEKNVATKKALFAQYHKAFLQYVQERLSPDKFSEDPKTGKLKLEQETYMKRLNERFGFTAPRSKDAAEFEGKKYDDWLDADFERFMSIKSVGQFWAAVATNVWGIIGPNSLPQAPLPPNRNVRSGSSGSNGTSSGQANGINSPAPEPSRAPDTRTSAGNETNTANESEENRESTEEFRTHFEPIVDRIVGHFGSQPLVYARGRSREMVAALRKAGMEVPGDVRNSEWALSKIVERFLELEVQDSFEQYETGFVGNEFLRYDDVYTKVGEAALWSLRHGGRFNFDHIVSPDSQIYLHMLFREGRTWEPDDLRKIGKILMDNA